MAATSSARLAPCLRCSRPRTRACFVWSARSVAGAAGGLSTTAAACSAGPFRLPLRPCAAPLPSCSTCSLPSDPPGSRRNARRHRLDPAIGLKPGGVGERVERGRRACGPDPGSSRSDGLGAGFRRLLRATPLACTRSRSGRAAPPRLIGLGVLLNSAVEAPGFVLARNRCRYPVLHPRSPGSVTA